MSEPTDATPADSPGSPHHLLRNALALYTSGRRWVNRRFCEDFMDYLTDEIMAQEVAAGVPPDWSPPRSPP